MTLNDTLHRITDVPQSVESDLSNEQVEHLLRTSLQLLRLRFHNGYYFNTYSILENLSTQLEQMYPTTGAEYRQIIHALIRKEDELLPQVLQALEIDITKKVEADEQIAISKLLTAETVQRDRSLLSYFLG